MAKEASLTIIIQVLITVNAYLQNFYIIDLPLFDYFFY